MSLAKNLAELHSNCGVYSSDSFKSGPNNILTELKRSPNLAYLSIFFKEYIESYGNNTNTEISDKKARSKDLFFIGEDILKTGATKFFFVFEGSLSDSDKLSMTVLSLLWLLNDKDAIIKELSNNWWTLSNYSSLKEKLKITENFARNSYVTDAIRVQSGEKYNNDKKSNDKKNQDLLYEEIRLLKPKLVVCVGKTAQTIMGMKYLDQDTKFHSVRFPKYHNETEGYEELSKIMEGI